MINHLRYHHELPIPKQRPGKTKSEDSVEKEAARHQRFYNKYKPFIKASKNWLNRRKKGEEIAQQIAKEARDLNEVRKEFRKRFKAFHKVLKGDAPLTLESAGENGTAKYLLDQAFVNVVGDWDQMISDLFGFSTDWDHFLQLPQSSYHPIEVAAVVDQQVPRTAIVGKLVQLLVALTLHGFASNRGKLEFLETAYIGNEVQPSFAEPQ